MSIKTLTVDDILALRPCGRYPREAVAKLFGKRKKATPKLVAAAKIPAEYRLWLLLRWPGMDESRRRLLAADVAEHVLPIFERDHPDDKRLRTAIDVARRYARGEETVGALNAAWAAAGDASRDAALAAAGAAEWRWILARAVRAATQPTTTEL
jgi:hypothetical protein